MFPASGGSAATWPWYHLDNTTLPPGFLSVYAPVAVASVNGSAGVYTQRSKAGWTFNGSGTIGQVVSGGSQRIWTKIDGVTGVGGDDASAIITNGDRVPYVVGPAANDLWQTATFTVGPG